MATRRPSTALPPCATSMPGTRPSTSSPASRCIWRRKSACASGKTARPAFYLILKRLPMNKSFIALALAAAFSSAALAQSAAPAPAAANAVVQVQPGDDFFNYVNGEWMARTEIPADRAAWGATSVMGEQVNARILQLIEGVAHDPKASV